MLLSCLFDCLPYLKEKDNLYFLQPVDVHISTFLAFMLAIHLVLVLIRLRDSWLKDWSLLVRKIYIHLVVGRPFWKRTVRQKQVYVGVYLIDQFLKAWIIKSITSTFLCTVSHLKFFGSNELPFFLEIVRAKPTDIHNQTKYTRRIRVLCINLYLWSSKSSQQEILPLNLHMGMNLHLFMCHNEWGNSIFRFRNFCNFAK